MQKRSRQCQTLTLSSGKITSLFQDRSLQPLFSLQKVCQTYLFQYLPQFFLRSLRASHAQVFPYRSAEQIALVTDIGDILHQACLRNLPVIHSSHLYHACISTVSVHENAGNGGFSTTAFAHNGGKTALTQHQIHTVQNLSVLFIRKTHLLQTDITVNRELLSHSIACSGRFLTGIPLRQIQQSENLLTGRHTIHGNMKKGTQLPHGNKEISRQKDDEQASGQIHFSRMHPAHRKDDSQCSTAISDKIHDRNRIQLHRQHFHGDLTELFRFRIHFLIFKSIRLIDFQSRQPL